MRARARRSKTRPVLLLCAINKPNKNGHRWLCLPLCLRLSYVRFLSFASTSDAPQLQVCSVHDDDDAVVALLVCPLRRGIRHTISRKKKGLRSAGCEPTSRSSFLFSTSPKDRNVLSRVASSHHAHQLPVWTTELRDSMRHELYGTASPKGRDRMHGHFLRRVQVRRGILYERASSRAGEPVTLRLTRQGFLFFQLEGPDMPGSQPGTPPRPRLAGPNVGSGW